MSLRLASGQVGLRWKPDATRRLAAGFNLFCAGRHTVEGLVGRRGSQGPKAARLLAAPNFRLRTETVRSEVGARSKPRSHYDVSSGDVMKLAKVALLALAAVAVGSRSAAAQSPQVET